MVLEATRKIGIDTGGYPTQPDASAIIRAVDNQLIEAMDLSVPLLTLVGGLSGFTVNAVKHEWVDGDNWRRRFSSHGGLAATTTTSLTVTAQAVRYPIGTLIKLEDEIIRVTGVVDADTLTVTRAQQGSTAATHASTVVGYVAGSSMHEGDDWVYRPTPVVTLPFNYCQLDHTALRNTWRRQSVNLYGLTGSAELDKLTADTLAQKTVAIEAGLINSLRNVGSSTSPASAGGMIDFITATNGADITAKAGGAVTWTDIYNMIDSIANAVGDENVGRVLVCDPWGHEKINSFFQGSRRMSNSEKIGGSIIETLIVEGLEFKVITLRSLSQVANMFLINTDNISVGHLGQVDSS